MNSKIPNIFITFNVFQGREEKASFYLAPFQPTSKRFFSLKALKERIFSASEATRPTLARLETAKQTKTMTDADEATKANDSGGGGGSSGGSTRKEIYTYKAPWTVFSLAWSHR